MNINASASSLYSVLLAISRVGLAAKIIANEALKKKKLLEKVIAEENTD